MAPKPPQPLQSQINTVSNTAPIFVEEEADDRNKES